jgi:hypothetical protein
VIIEIDGQIYNTTDIFYCPDWWDKWQEENFKKKVILFFSRFRQLEEDRSDSEEF